MSNDKVLNYLDYTAPGFKDKSELDVIVNLDSSSWTRLCIDSADQQIVQYVHDASIPPEDLLQLNESNIRNRLLLVNTPFTLIPNSEFDESSLQLIAREAFPFDDSSEVHYSTEAEVVIVFLLPLEIKRTCQLYFEGYPIRHSITGLLRTQVHHDPSILAHWSEEGISVLVMNDGLQMANFYRIQVPEDAIYFILAAYDHTNFDPLEQPLTMSGRISRDSMYYEKLSGFVRDFSWAKPDRPVPPDFDFDPHLIYHLYTG